MTEKLTLRNLFMIAIAVMLSVSFTSCFGDVDEEEWIEQPAIETGLCGETWVWEKATGDDETGKDEWTDDTVVREVYEFDLSGSGRYEYECANGDNVSHNFTWKSLKNANTALRMLYIVLDGVEYGTYYAIENMTTLRILVVDETSETGTTTKDFRAE